MCSLNVFVIVIVFVFVIVFLLVRSCPLITLIKYLKGHKSLGSLFVSSLNVFVFVSVIVFVIVFVFVFVFVINFLLVMSCLLITLIKCLKGHKSLGSLCSVVKTLIVSGVRRTDQGTRSPIELFWTAKNSLFVLFLSIKIHKDIKGYFPQKRVKKRHN